MALNIVSHSSTKQLSRSPDFPATATVAADIATLVADGAAPTQAHVNTLNTNWGTFLASENLSRAGQVFIGYDTTLTKNQIKDALNALLKQIEGIA